MRIIMSGIALAGLAVPALAAAQDAPAAVPAAPAVALKSGAVLTSSDGRRIGRIERILEGADGAPVSASVILDSRFVYIPVATITPSEKGFTTSLTRAELRKLK